jgi:hypothetical protein
MNGRLPLKVLSGAFKEDATEPFLLTYNSLKHGGSTEISLSVYTNWTNRIGMTRDQEVAKEIKRGLTEIIGKSVNHGLLGLEVDKAFKSLAWTVKPFQG